MSEKTPSERKVPQKDQERHEHELIDAMLTSKIAPPWQPAVEEYRRFYRSKASTN